MNVSHAECDAQDITRAAITQDIGVVAVTDSHGLLLAISSQHFLHGWVKREIKYDELEKINVRDIFHEELATVVDEGIAFFHNNRHPTARTYVCDIFVSRKTYVTMLEQVDGRLVIEIEDFGRRKFKIKDIVNTANVIGKLTSSSCQEDAANDLCDDVFRSYAYDRAMTYRFFEDLSGEVIYEVMREGVQRPPFIGLRFPASDIPLPARNAFVKNPVRFIADAEKPSCHLMQKDESIRLSRSYLRGCVAPHRAYLRSMGVVSSLSIAITNVEGNLWGLIILHSYSTPIVPTIEDRISYSILASVASSHIQHIDYTDSISCGMRLDALVSKVDTKTSLGVFITQNTKQVLETFRIDSLTLFAPDGLPVTIGHNAVKLEDLPIEQEALVYGSLQNPVRSFVRFNLLGHVIVFTRTASCDPIIWAGNPEAAIKSRDSTGVMPRPSFETFTDYPSSQHPPPFTRQDRRLFSKTADVLKSIIHQMTIERVERRILQAKKESEMVEMKSDRDLMYFANMSHELRTPLHAISGVFDILHELESGERAESVRRYSKIGLSACGDMMKTLNDILSVARKTHETKQVDTCLVMVKDIFTSTANGLKVFASKNDVDFEIGFECDPCEILRVDVQKITQIFNNICGNAIKFSKFEGRVDVQVHVLTSAEDVSSMWTTVSAGYAGRHNSTCDETNHEETGNICKWLVFQTRDHGCGLHQNDLSNIFQIFTQVGDVVTKKFASTGLGLHICLSHVKTLHGRLDVASTPDKGTLFFCALPVERVSDNTDTSVPKKDLVATTPVDTTHGLGAKDVVFVVVDDSKVNLMIAKKQIQRAFVNAKVYTAQNGKLGVEEVERLVDDGIHIDGIFMDYHMPVMSGLEATRQVRKQKSPVFNKKVPVAMLTADITEFSRQSMLASGADFILLKPSKPKDIEEMCVKMLQL